MLGRRSSTGGGGACELEEGGALEREGAGWDGGATETESEARMGVRRANRALLLHSTLILDGLDSDQVAPLGIF
jgi:hypothetical protein